MSKCEEFLELYQLCQTTKRCMGQDCPDVNNQAMEQARLIDLKASELPNT